MQIVDSAGIDQDGHLECKEPEEVQVVNDVKF